MSFVHLHVHTEHFPLDGVYRTPLLIKRAREPGQSAMATTDHGVMYGMVGFYKACKAERVKPIIDCEVYVAPRKHTGKVCEYDAAMYRLILLCRSEVDYRSLCSLDPMAFTEGFYIRPRIDKELLRQHAGGLIALSVYQSGKVSRKLLIEDHEGTKTTALEMRALFGEDGYYLELRGHRLPNDPAANQGLIYTHQETGTPLVVTNDVHYLHRKNVEMQDTFMRTQMGKTVNDPSRLRMGTSEPYVKSTEEMAALLPDYPEMVENTVKVAELCNMNFQFGVHHLPESELPGGHTGGGAYFQKLCEEGSVRCYLGALAEYWERLAYEMEIIRQMGFVDYFLTISDFIGYAEGRGIPVGSGRDLAAGSMVAYCMATTDADPMKYSLYLERFLDPEQVIMPDIDIDFCIRRWQKVIEYVQNKYGADYVTQTATFGTMAARGATRDVGRTLNVPYTGVGVVAKQVPSGPGALHITLDEVLKLSKPLRDTHEGGERIKTLIDTTKAIEGISRHAPIHATDVAIIRKPVANYMPLARNDESVITQYVMTTLEELDLLKIDFLGLRNLTILGDTVRLVQKSRPSFFLADTPDNNLAVFQMLSEGRTSGVLQMESAGMIGARVGLKLQNIEDITAIIAPYRPDPADSTPRFIACKYNPDKVEYKHPMLEPIPSATCGCVIYQEQVVEIFRGLAGYTLGQADMVRRIMSKEKVKDIEREQQAFAYGGIGRAIAGCIANGVLEDMTKDIYDEIYAFANYAFSKAHAVAYAIVCYQAAWFKCHYTKECMVALLTFVLDSSEKVAEHIAKYRNYGIHLLPSDINKSEAGLTAPGKYTRFGLVVIKGVSRGFINAVLTGRGRGGPLVFFPDFYQWMLDAGLNKRALESLVRCDASDSMGTYRSRLLEVYGQFVDSITQDKCKNLASQLDLFGGGGDQTQNAPELQIKNILEFTRHGLMTMEEEMTGLYFTDRPMDEHRDMVKQRKAALMGAILSDSAQKGGPAAYHSEQRVTLAGIITTSHTRTIRNNSLMTYVMLGDDTAPMEILVLARVLGEVGPYLKEGMVVLAKGRISVRDEKTPQLMCDRVRPLDQMKGNLPSVEGEERAKKFYIRIPSLDGPHWEGTKLVLTMSPSTEQMAVRCEDTGKRLDAVRPAHPVLIQELNELLGAESVVVR